MQLYSISVFCECCVHQSAVMVMAVVVAMAKAVVDATLHAHALSVSNPFPFLLANAAAAGVAGQLFPWWLAVVLWPEDRRARDINNITYTKLKLKEF